MTLSRFAFWFFILWIVGCGCVATGISIHYIVLGVALGGAVFLCIGTLYEKHIWYWFALLVLAIIIGSGYALWYRWYTNPYDENIVHGNQTITGTILSSPRIYESTQSFIIQTAQRQKISIQTSLVHTVHYADTVDIIGRLEPLASSTQYLAREGVVAVVSFADIKSVAKPKTFSLHRTLYDIRDLITGVFSKLFSRDQAALASGLLLGQQSASFSSALKNDMKLSGTTHLVALSGYNIAIVIQVLYGLLSFIWSRKKSFLFLIAGVVLFVFMTGAESSVVRAAIMGSLVLVAERLSRIYSFSHAMAATAWIMILFNPLSFVFDIGFVLSFVSLWGLAYLAPIILSWIKKIPRVPDWFLRAFSQTVGAQIVVMPLLVYWFGGASLSGVVTNIILLPLVPLVMGLSFIIGLIGLIFLPLGFLGSFIISPLLWLFTTVIHVGAQFGFTRYSVSWVGVGLVYVLLVGVGLVYKKKEMQEIIYQV